LGNTKTLETGRATRRSSAEIPILEPAEMDGILQGAGCSRDSCLGALLYLTGRRIGEVLPLRRGDFTYRGYSVSFRTFNEKSFRATRRSPFVIQRPECPERFYEAIEPQYSAEGPSGVLLDHYVKGHLYGLKPGDYVFSPRASSSKPYISQPRAYQIIRGLDDRLWLHALRNINFTRLAEVYSDDPVSMHRLTFHKRFESTLIYVKKRDTADRLKRV